MSSLYEYLKNDRDKPLGRILQVLFKKMYIDRQYHKDAEQECLLAWMEAEYNPFFDNDSIISFAYNCARLRLSEWRRRTLLPVCTSRSERPEPVSISLESLHGDSLERFVDETQYLCEGPLVLLSKLEDTESKDDESEYSVENLSLPSRSKDLGKFRDPVQMLLDNRTLDEIADSLGVSKRTIYRRMNVIKQLNQQTKNNIERL